MNAFDISETSRNSVELSDAELDFNGSELSDAQLEAIAGGKCNCGCCKPTAKPPSGLVDPFA